MKYLIKDKAELCTYLCIYICMYIQGVSQKRPSGINCNMSCQVIIHCYIKSFWKIEDIIHVFLNNTIIVID